MWWVRHELKLRITMHYIQVLVGLAIKVWNGSADFFTIRWGAREHVAPARAVEVSSQPDTLNTCVITNSLTCLVTLGTRNVPGESAKMYRRC